MTKARTALTTALLGASLAAASGPAAAHHSNDWGLPLVGGALGGLAVGAYVANQEESTQPVHQAPAAPPVQYVPVQPVQYAPAHAAPAPASSSTASIEARLKQLDALAAGGYITPQEYQARRTQILNSL